VPAADSDQLTFLATCDLAAKVRGRAATDDDVRRRGVGWVPANLAINAFGGLADNMFGSTGDLRLRPVETTLILPAADGGTAKIQLAEQVTTDGEPWPGCPRTLARTALDRLRDETGMELVASFEHEFVLHGLPESAPFSWQRFRHAEAFGLELVQLLTDNGLEPENWLPEYAPGQFEITLRPAPALIAADRAILLRELVRDTARRHGYTATFGPLLEPGGVGNGVHVHLSVLDADGNPVLYDASRTAGLSDWGLRFAGGIANRAAALTALTAPSPSSFLRLRPHRWSVAGAFVAERNREALVRVCPTSSLVGDPARQLNLEYRACDATANPWTVIAALVHAGLSGLKEPEPKLWPETMTEADTESVPRLPENLRDALKALSTDPVFTQHIPYELLDTYQAVKQSELDVVAEVEDDEVCRRVCDVY
jgi:glutamine synthetase